MSSSSSRVVVGPPPRFGVVTRYERDGAALNEAELARCNAAA